VLRISAPRYPTESIPLPVISRIGQLERGPHESDDHTYADKQIGENDGGAIIDARGPSVGRTASPVQCTKLVLMFARAIDFRNRAVVQKGVFG